MATTITTKRLQGDDPSAVNKALRESFNALLTKFNALLDKLDADGGVTDETYGSLLGSDIATQGIAYLITTED